MSIFGQIAEEKIKVAMNAGEFDCLPGKGKPLAQHVNPYEPEEARLAHHLLKENDLTLPWIESRQEIEREVAQLRVALRVAVSRGGDAASHLAASGLVTREIARLNRKILQHNAQVPSPVFERSTLDIEVELRRANESIL